MARHSSRNPKNRPNNTRLLSRSSGPIRKRTSLLLELLEDRTAPAVLTVNTFDDLTGSELATEQVSLRSALLEANTTPEADTIILQAGTYTLTKTGIDENAGALGDLDIIQDVIIQGEGAGVTIIDANSLDRVFQIFATATVEIHDVTITNGSVTGAGGGILNSGSLILDGVIVQDNEAIGDAGNPGVGFTPGTGGDVNGFGGGIFNQGTLSILRSSILSNIAQGGAGGTGGSAGSSGGGGGMGAGGGIYHESGNLTIDSSTFASNMAIGGEGGVGENGNDGAGSGGGGAGGDSVPVPGTSDNGGYGGGGGGGSSTDRDDILGGTGGAGGFGGGGGGGGSSLDTPGSGGSGGLYGGAGGSAISNGSGGGGGGAGAGGGIFVENGTVELVNSTLAGNGAVGGVGGQVAIGNFADGGQGGDGLGGALFLFDGNVNVVNNTVAFNVVEGGFEGSDGIGEGEGRGGGFFIHDDGLTVANTILHENIEMDGLTPVANNYTGLIDSTGNNLFGPDVDGDVSGPGVTFTVNPFLGPLQDNGGPTQTIIPTGNEALIRDSGNDTEAPELDQRGVPRDGTSDIGAVELSNYVVTNSDEFGPGSLAQAITNNNNSSGGNTITFLIGSTGSIHTINVEAGPLPEITKPVVIDGWSQGGVDYNGSPLIEIDGSRLLSAEVGLHVRSDDVVIRGLAINNMPEESGVFSGYGIAIEDDVSFVRIYGNYIGTDLTGRIAKPNERGGIFVGSLAGNVWIGSDGDGQDDEQEGNVISGNAGDGIFAEGDDIFIIGNYIGLAADGTTALGNTGDGIDAKGDNVQITGALSFLPNVISENGRNGIFLSGTGGTVQGNIIGLTADGLSAAGNGLNGILLVGSFHTIGGLDDELGNVISANDVHGIAMTSDSVTVVNNKIGTQIDGLSYAGNSSKGVEVLGFNNVIGGTSPEHGNIIAHNGIISTGLTNTEGDGNTFRFNSFFENVGLGIDLGDPGITLNDVDDADSGANHQQNFPEISEVLSFGGELAVTFSVPSSPTHSAYPLIVDFYAVDATGSQGQTWLGSTTVEEVDAQLSQSVSFVPNVPISTDITIVATATDDDGNTSEFSSPADSYTGPLNLSATATPSSTTEGQIVTFSGNFDILTPGQSHFVSIDLGPTLGVLALSLDADVSTFSVDVFYSDNYPLGEEVVGITVTDSFGQSVSTSLIVEVVNVAPTAELTNSGSVKVGEDVTVEFTNVTDPSIRDTVAGFLYSLDFDGDNIFEIEDSTETSHAIPDAFLTTPGVYEVTGRIEDKDGAFTTSVTTFTVFPEDFLTEEEFFLGVGDTFEETGTFTIPGAREVLANVSYGDSSTAEILTISGDNSFLLSHVYAEEGTFELTVGVIADGAFVTEYSYPVYVLPDTPVTVVIGTNTDGTVTATIPGAITATAITDNDDLIILVAVLPNEVTELAIDLDLVEGIDEDDEVLSTYDIRVINADQNDSITIDFFVDSPTGEQPVLRYFNVRTGRLELVVGGGNGLEFERLTETLYRVRLILNATSTPRVTDLTGTVFTFTASGATDSQPPTPSPSLRTLFRPTNQATVLASNGTAVTIQPSAPVNITSGAQSQQVLSSSQSDGEVVGFGTTTTSGADEEDDRENNEEDQQPEQTQPELIQEEALREALQLIEDAHESAWTLPASAAQKEPVNPQTPANATNPVELSEEKPLDSFFSDFGKSPQDPDIVPPETENPTENFWLEGFDSSSIEPFDNEEMLQSVAEHSSESRSDPSLGILALSLASGMVVDTHRGSKFQKTKDKSQTNTKSK